MHSMWHASECVGKTASSLSRLTGPWPGSASSAEALSAVRRYAELDANAISHLPAEPGEDGEKGTHPVHRQWIDYPLGVARWHGRRSWIHALNVARF